MGKQSKFSESTKCAAIVSLNCGATLDEVARTLDVTTRCISGWRSVMGFHSPSDLTAEQALTVLGLEADLDEWAADLAAVGILLAGRPVYQ
jgi:hypothetical protein